MHKIPFALVLLVIILAFASMIHVLSTDGQPSVDQRVISTPTLTVHPTATVTTTASFSATPESSPSPMPRTKASPSTTASTAH